VEIEYVPTKPDGKADQPVKFQWDLASNTGTASVASQASVTPNPAGGLTSTLNYTNGAPLARLTWTSTAGARYQVWAASDLNVGFQPYGSPVASEGDETTSVLVPANALRMFFRIERLAGE
jgi:hypothetical protein